MRDLAHQHPGRRVVLAADGFRYLDATGTILDVFNSGRVEVQLATYQTGLPISFYGTVAGLLLALRGGLPMHGSAVELGGEAVLICGPSGAGKSTAAAALIATGARLISDDLSVISLPGGVPHLFAGRRTIRLFDDVAGYLAERVTLPPDPAMVDGKLAVQPPQVDPTRAIRLGTVIVLGDPPAPSRGLFAAQLFRPARLQQLPGHQQRLAMVAISAGQTRVISAEKVEARSAEAFADAGRRLLALWQG